MEKKYNKYTNLLLIKSKNYNGRALINKICFALKDLIIIIKIKKKYFFFLFYTFSFLISYILYYLSLEKCMKGQIECSKMNKWIKKKLSESICCSFILSFLIELMILKLLSKKNLIHIFIVFFFFYIYSHGLEFYDHGLFNFIGCIIIIIIILIVILPFNFLIYLIKKKNRYLIFIYISLLIIFLFYYLNYISTFLGCNDWPKGLNDTSIENNIDKYGCQIIIPKYCPYKIGKYFFDITKKTGIRCGNDLKTKKRLLRFSKTENINENTTRIGFPLTNKDYMCLKKLNYNKGISISMFTKKNLIDMDNKTQLKKIGKENYPEIIIDFSQNIYGEMIINLNYNESLSKERIKKEKNTKPYSKNIIILYFDSVSRRNALTQLKKTVKFFEKFMPYKGAFNQKYPTENYHSFQFFKYHSFYFFTHGNYPKLFYGKDKSKNMTRITKYLKENGYITAFSNDMCLRDPLFIPRDMTFDEICDHELILCDPNKKSTNSMIKKCLYNEVNAWYQYEYGLQFWRKYKNNRRFLLIVNNDGHEGTLEILKYDDDIVFNFLNTLYKENMLKETTIMLLSDHGCPMPSIYYFNKFFRLEKNLPMLFLFTYDKTISYNEQYKYIYENQQKFITSYDIYNTILYLIYGNYFFIRPTPKSKLGANIFTSINPKRTPYNYISMPLYTCVKIKKKNINF